MADTVRELLTERSGDDNVAVRFHDETLSWREYIAGAERMAAAVLALADRDRPMHVGVLLDNTPTMLTAIAAGALGGYVTVGINDTRRGAALVRDIGRSDCQILLTDAAHRDQLSGLDLGAVRVIDTSSDEWEARLADADALTPTGVPGAADPFMLIFTSGTSGDPKPVRLAHMLVPFAGTSLVERFTISPDDVCYLPMPLFHSAALLGGYCVALASGAAMVPAHFSASTFLDDVRRYGVTYMNYVGKPLAYILATPPRPDDADNPLKVAFGNEASGHDIDAFAERFGCEVSDAFGSTELGIIITREPGTPPGSVGRGFPGVAVYNPESTTECPPAAFDSSGALANGDEAIGELVNTDGPGMFTGYYNDAQTTDQRMRGGMYWSGDLGYRDADGWIYLAGRTGDWMRVDGENITAGPIERILQRIPGVNRVAVYPVPDRAVGDAVMAAMVLDDGAQLTPEQFAGQLAEQPDLSATQWPSYVRVATDLPATATNKIIKRVLKEQGATPGNGVLWERPARTREYRVAAPS